MLRKDRMSAWTLYGRGYSPHEHLQRVCSNDIQYLQKRPHPLAQGAAVAALWHAAGRPSALPLRLSCWVLGLGRGEREGHNRAPHSASDAIGHRSTNPLPKRILLTGRQHQQRGVAAVSLQDKWRRTRGDRSFNGEARERLRDSRSSLGNLALRRVHGNAQQLLLTYIGSTRLSGTRSFPNDPAAEAFDGDPEKPGLDVPASEPAVEPVGRPKRS